jgi:OOP family OmpA-OmpF porin
MRNTFTRKEFALALACALAFGILSESANAQVRDLNEKALLTDSRGAPVMSVFGPCWHTSFGPPPQWTPGCHPQAVPVAAAVAPFSVVVAAPAAPLPVYEKVSLDANVLFASGSSVLRPAGRAALDQFVAGIHGLDKHIIAAIGHADRMGSEGANQALSEKRVDAVKAYLIGKGITAERVETSARGETRPTTSAGECKDANNTKNVACMQPDRHVFITVSGTRVAK